uniref:PH domain-containing protein n=1 Tax=Callorhinchus milii TaxID=7868 RepID=A0A4W3ICE5_CALMI
IGTYLLDKEKTKVQSSSPSTIPAVARHVLTSHLFLKQTTPSASTIHSSVRLSISFPPSPPLPSLPPSLPSGAYSTRSLLLADHFPCGASHSLLRPGISNPFRGLLKLGNLERRGPVGIWKEFYCELSPFEFRLYLNDESRTCYENCSLLRCEAVLALGDGRFELLCSGRRLCLRAASPDEAEDWTDRIREALVKCRPQNASQRAGGARPRAAPGGEERQRQRPAAETAPRESLSPDWVCRSEPQLDAIKETVLCVLVGERWLPCVCSLSLEALICSQLRGGKRELVTSCRTDSFRDVVPDTALGGPAYFKLVTSGAALQLQAENGEEARAWRELIRAVLTCHREAVDGVAGEEGADERNGQRLVQLGLGEYSPLLRCLTAVPNERGLDQQNQQCAGCPRRIGFSFGKLKLCAFSGLYYCESCHHDTEVIIPSRVIHNWDLKKRGVSPAVYLHFVWCVLRVRAPARNVCTCDPCARPRADQTLADR